MISGTPPTPASLEIARRLIARERTPDREREPDTTVLMLQTACRRVCETLRDSMGEDGCNALFARALARAAPEHPVLGDLRHPNGGGVCLGGAVARMEAHGMATATQAIEAMFAALADILGRLIGDDMTTRLLGLDVSSSPAPTGARSL